MNFEWDPEKAASNFRKHGVTFEEAATVFQDPGTRTWPDPKHSHSERREITIGSSRDGRLLFVSHTDRDGRIRVISARPVSAAERRQHAQEKTER